MWQLIKAEIQYYKWLYIVGLTLVVLINFGLTIDNHWIEAQGNFPGLRTIWIGIGIVVLFYPILSSKRNGRLRTVTILPVSLTELALARLFPFVMFWIMLLLILTLFYFLNFKSIPTNDWLFNLFGITGVMFFINSIPILNSDFYSTYFNKKEKTILGLLWLILWIGYIALNIIFLTFFDSMAPEFFAGSRKILETYYFSNIGIIINFVLGTTMFFSTLVTFKKRLLYLE